ncbi:MAG: hypothetical protein WCS15_02430, partial [Prevotella sp.]
IVEDKFRKRKEVRAVARPSSSAGNLNSHTTKAELRQREEAEKSVLSGIGIKENEDVKDDPVAHSEFKRVLRLLKAVGKNDALYEAVINDYCTYKSDVARYIQMRKDIEIDEAVDGSSRYTLVMSCDKQAEVYRKKRFDIEKENGFTIASALRSIPKKVSTKGNPLARALRDDD